MHYTPGEKLTSNALLQRYKITRRTLSRWMVDEKMKFPKPLAINGRLYFEAAEIEDFERRSVSRHAEAA